jgi:hypothetical protein
VHVHPVLGAPAVPSPALGTGVGVPLEPLPALGAEAPEDPDDPEEAPALPVCAGGTLPLPLEPAHEHSWSGTQVNPSPHDASVVHGNVYFGTHAD